MLNGTQFKGAFLPKSRRGRGGKVVGRGAHRGMFSMVFFGFYAPGLRGLTFLHVTRRIKPAIDGFSGGLSRESCLTFWCACERT